MTAMKLRVLNLLIPVLILAILSTACSNSDGSTDFNVLVWNIWHGGNDESLPSDGRPSVVQVIQESEADIVLMIETYGSAPYISEQTGMDYELLSSNLCIFSKFPIIRKIEYPESIATFNFGGVEILVDDSLPVLVFDTWLHYLPDTRLVPLDKGQSEILAWENEGSRDNEIKAILEVLQPEISQSNQVPIIIGGDLNSHSHLDWTEKTRDIHNHGGAAVDWTVSRKLYTDGFVDAFREIHQNPEKMPGKTWISAWENDKQVFNRIDRIDYCYYQGGLLQPVHAESHTAIPGDTLLFSGKEIMYPSDHGFVLVTFRMKTGN